MSKNLSQMTIHELQQEKDKTISAKSEADALSIEFKLLLEGIERELQKRLKPATKPKVSDHALFRYIERVYNIDLEAVRAEILTDSAISALKMGATGIKSNGVKFKAKDGVITTVLT